MEQPEFPLCAMRRAFLLFSSLHAPRAGSSRAIAPPARHGSGDGIGWASPKNNAMPVAVVAQLPGALCEWSRGHHRASAAHDFTTTRSQA